MVGSWWSFLWPCDTGWTAQVETLLMSLDPTSSSCCWWRGQPKTEAVFKIPAKPITINDHLFLDVWTTGHCLHSWSNLVQLSLQLLVGAWSPAQSCSSGCWNWTRPTLIWRKRVSDSLKPYFKNYLFLSWQPRLKRVGWIIVEYTNKKGFRGVFGENYFLFPPLPLSVILRNDRDKPVNHGDEWGRRILRWIWWS